MSNELKHTPEPWKIKDKQPYTIIISTDPLRYVIVNGFESTENAERIVACIDACKGIPNKWLKDTETAEKVITRKLFDEFRKLEEDAKKQKDLIDEIYCILLRQLSEPTDQDTGVMLSICTKIEESRKCH